MPDNGDPEFPPTFGSSELSSLIGQINDFAGNPPPSQSEMMTFALKSSTAEQAPMHKLKGAGMTPVPVSIVGTVASKVPYLPGLRDLLIGVSYLRLAEQINDTSLKASSQKQAYALMQAGHKALGQFLAQAPAIKGPKK